MRHSGSGSALEGDALAEVERMYRSAWVSENAAGLCATSRHRYMVRDVSSLGIVRSLTVMNLSSTSSSGIGFAIWSERLSRT
jgi:hypothetical protein